MQLFGIDLVGMTSENGRKLLVSAGYGAAVFALGWLLRKAIRAPRLGGGQAQKQTRFWMHQAVSLATAFVLIVGSLSIWFNDVARLTAVLGMLSAALVFALQQLVTAVAGYFVILFGKNFTIGDRISMGGVRGDVVQLSFTQTTIMEMGQPPGSQPADPSVWVRSRQFTGRIVTVSNAQIFKEPVYNYTRDIPFIWEEMLIPIPYDADRDRAEQIMLAAVRRHGYDSGQVSAERMKMLETRFNIDPADLKPRVFYRLTDNWVELSLRFTVDSRQVREVKDAISRDIVRELEEAGIRVASGTYEIVGVPPLRIEATPKGDAA